MSDEAVSRGDGEIYLSPRFACTVVGDVVVGFHSEDEPNDEDWSAYLGAGRRIMDDSGEVRVLAYSLGGGPNSAQRNQVNELFKEKSQRVAVMLNSRLARGAVTALSWFNKQIQAFSLDQLDDACRHLGLTPSETNQIRDVLEDMRVRLLAARGG